MESYKFLCQHGKNLRSELSYLCRKQTNQIPRFQIFVNTHKISKVAICLSISHRNITNLISIFSCSEFKPKNKKIFSPKNFKKCLFFKKIWAKNVFLKLFSFFKKKKFFVCCFLDKQSIKCPLVPTYTFNSFFRYFTAVGVDRKQ